LANSGNAFAIIAIFLVIKTPDPDQHWPKMLDPDPHLNQCGFRTLCNFVMKK
jgi:hypothetical protein